MLRSEKSERNNSSDGSDQFGYEDRTTLFGSNKNLIRKLSDPLQVKVKRSVKDDSPSSMKSMLYEPRENFRKNTIHEESKELPRNTTGRFNSEEKNMSIDSSKSIPGLGSSIYYDGEEVSKKLTKPDKKT
mmetsp:Transcript_9126/g.8726  ORF Transcript_9126/g.8726 Transcript_9126/m.8726 type:complete len:130 (-) Transcript_9126:137-526(-)